MSKRSNRRKSQLMSNISYYNRRGLDSLAKVKNRYGLIKDSRGNVYVADQQGWRFIGQQNA